MAAGTKEPRSDYMADLVTALNRNSRGNLLEDSIQASFEDIHGITSPKLRMALDGDNSALAHRSKTATAAKKTT